jgi:hypothetical protein
MVTNEFSLRRLPTSHLDAQMERPLLGTRHVGDGVTFATAPSFEFKMVIYPAIYPPMEWRQPYARINQDPPLYAGGLINLEELVVVGEVAV